MGVLRDLAELGKLGFLIMQETLRQQMSADHSFDQNLVFEEGSARTLQETLIGLFKLFPKNSDSRYCLRDAMVAYIH